MMIERLDQNEILRYLGYKDSGVTEQIQSLLDRCENETLQVIQPKFVYQRFPIEKLSDGIHVAGTTLVLKGQAIAEHLKNCEEVFLMGATAGMALDRWIRRYMISEPDAGVILDSCGIQAVEQISNLAENEMEMMVLKEGLHLTWRFSPGYGDLPLETQQELVRVLNLPKRIGVSLSESFLMMPSKSVTAILGIQDTKKDVRQNKCDFCNNKERCLFRKRGTRC